MARTDPRPNYGSGRISRGGGYIAVRRPGHPLADKQGYVMEHRLVLWEAGIEIPDGHHVHHLNGDKTDNRIENLTVVSASDHQREHLAAGVVKNGHGTWPVLRDEKELTRRRNVRARERMNAWRRAKRAQDRGAR